MEIYHPKKEQILMRPSHDLPESELETCEFSL